MVYGQDTTGASAIVVCSSVWTYVESMKITIVHCIIIVYIFIEGYKEKALRPVWWLTQIENFKLYVKQESQFITINKMIIKSKLHIIYERKHTRCRPKPGIELAPFRLASSPTRLPLAFNFIIKLQK